MTPFDDRYAPTSPDWDLDDPYEPSDGSWDDEFSPLRPRLSFVQLLPLVILVLVGVGGASAVAMTDNTTNSAARVSAKSEVIEPAPTPVAATPATAAALAAQEQRIRAIPSPSWADDAAKRARAAKFATLLTQLARAQAAGNAVTYANLLAQNDLAKDAGLTGAELAAYLAWFAKQDAAAAQKAVDDAQQAADDQAVAEDQAAAEHAQYCYALAGDLASRGLAQSGALAAAGCA